MDLKIELIGKKEINYYNLGFELFHIIFKYKRK